VDERKQRKEWIARRRERMRTENREEKRTITTGRFV